MRLQDRVAIVTGGAQGIGLVDERPLFEEQKIEEEGDEGKRRAELVDVDGRFAER